MLALAFYDVLYFFGALIASDSTSCSSSFCTFSLSSRHFSWWISCVYQHLKIVWESSKSDPANFGRITRHTFALHAAPKLHKCDNFRELFDPLPPSDQCWILCWWSNLCVWQHLSFQHWLGGEGGRDQFLTFMWSENSMMRSFFIAFLALKWINFFLNSWVIVVKIPRFGRVSLWALPGILKKIFCRSFEKNKSKSTENQ